MMFPRSTEQHGFFEWVRSMYARVAGRVAGLVPPPAAGRNPSRTHHYPTAPEPVPLRPQLLALHVASATPWLRVRRVACNDNRTRPKRRAF